MNKAIIIAAASVSTIIIGGVVAIHTHAGSDFIINAKHTPEPIRNFVCKYRAKRNAKAAVKTAEASIKSAEKAAAAAARSAANIFTHAARAAA